MDASLGERGDEQLVTGYVPTFRDIQDWQKVFRQEHVTVAGSVVRRVIWVQAANRGCRLLVDIADCRTSNQAQARLTAITRSSNVQFVEGPVRLGRGALVHPLDQPRSVYLMRANLLIWVLNCGREYFDVLACADRIVADLEAPAPQEAEEDLVLSRQPDHPEAPAAICLSIESRWERGEWAWYKFTAQGGTLARAPERDRLFLWPVPGHQEIKVSGWAMEPGRRTYRGQYVHTL